MQVDPFEARGDPCFGGQREDSVTLPQRLVGFPRKGDEPRSHYDKLFG